ncbi:MAG: hypothetical protein CVV41_22900 [Candidatus Riflebacteria bacterium HGW-Riflebacteria-1]|jgi:hypothetical protein|nr:MAG: hypothetical protein CVV41_22900 [Candidatus Riflebacteria bacterium HGW-Riflebacteria-1]
MKKTVVKILLSLLIFVPLVALVVTLSSPVVETNNINYKSESDRGKMFYLKSSLISFKADLGYLPFAGQDARDSDAYFSSTNAGLGFENDTNCLVTAKSDFFQRMGLSEEKYNKQWKGPYLDRSVSDYFLDSYGNPIIYVCWNNAIYLWSAGDDEKFDFSINLETNTGKRHGVIPEGQADDIVVKVCELQGMNPPRLIFRDRILDILASLPKKQN